MVTAVVVQGVQRLLVGVVHQLYFVLACVQGLALVEQHLDLFVQGIAVALQALELIAKLVIAEAFEPRSTLRLVLST